MWRRSARDFGPRHIERAARAQEEGFAGRRRDRHAEGLATLPFHPEVQRQGPKLFFQRRVPGVARAVVAEAMEQAAHSAATANRRRNDMLFGVIRRRYIAATISAD